MKRYQTDQCAYIQLVRSKQSEQLIDSSPSVKMEERSRTHILLKFNFKGIVVCEQLIRRTYTDQPFGGERMWFICPITGQKAQKLYLPPNGMQFASVTGHNLAYASQNVSDKHGQLYLKLLNFGELYNGRYLLKPKWQHTKTFEKNNESFNKIRDMYEQLTLLKLKKLEAAHQAWCKKSSIA
jgi:hypothetical protein